MTQNMGNKILFAGNWEFYIYEEVFSVALKELGFEIVPFKISEYFKGSFNKVQKAIPVPGPVLIRINNDLKKIIRKEKPSLLFAWRCTHLLPSTVLCAHKNGILTVSYNNDDPFGSKVHKIAPWHHTFFWFWYKKCLQHFDYNFFYRTVNLFEYQKLGMTNGKIMLPYFIPWMDKPVKIEITDKNIECDVVFIGHFENDNRIEYLRALVQSGLHVKLYGDESWTPERLKDLYAYFAPVVMVRGEHYAKALSAAKVCLAFLSKLNRDTYTRRCFEIPACGKVMLAERTEDLTRLFNEDEEACFFSNSEELVQKAKWLVNNSDVNKRIGYAGQKRVWKDKHDVKSRAEEFVTSIGLRHNKQI